MGILSRLFGRSSEAKDAKRKTGNAQTKPGAGPALAAHSKDAKSAAKSGHNSKAAQTKAKSPAKPAEGSKAASAKGRGSKAATAPRACPLIDESIVK